MTTPWEIGMFLRVYVSGSMIAFDNQRCRCNRRDDVEHVEYDVDGNAGQMFR